MLLSQFTDCKEIEYVLLRLKNNRQLKGSAGSSVASLTIYSRCANIFVFIDG